MPRQLTKEELKEAEECFSIFSKQGNMAIGDLGSAIRSMGFNPSNSNVNKIISDVGSPSSINFETFKKILAGDMPPPDTAEHIREAFGVFDKDGNGLISAHELRHILMSTGERLTEEEVNVMISSAEIDVDGNINYEQFVQVMARQL